MAPAFASPLSRLLEGGRRFEPHDKTMPGMGPHHRGDGEPAGAGDGRRKRGAAGPQGGAACTPALAVGLADRRARDEGRTGGNARVGGRRGRGAEVGQDGATGLPDGRRILRGSGAGTGTGTGRPVATARSAGRGGPAGTAVGGGENPAATHGIGWMEALVKDTASRKRKGEIIIPMKSEQQDEIIPTKKYLAVLRIQRNIVAPFESNKIMQRRAHEFMNRDKFFPKELCYDDTTALIHSRFHFIEFMIVMVETGIANQN